MSTNPPRQLYAQVSRFQGNHLQEYYENPKRFPLHNQTGYINVHQHPNYFSNSTNGYYNNPPTSVNQSLSNNHSPPKMNQPTSFQSRHAQQPQQYYQYLQNPRAANISYMRPVKNNSRISNIREMHPQMYMQQRNSMSPGSLLFKHLKDYGNNMYSLFLHEIDLKNLTVNPSKSKEVNRVLDTLNKVQIDVQRTSNIKNQERKVRDCAIDLSTQNITLAIAMYKEKAAQILQDIDKIMASKLKYIPTATKVLNYIKPNFSKRRLYNEIFPKIFSEISNLIAELNEKHMPPQGSMPTPMAIEINANPTVIVNAPLLSNELPLDKEKEIEMQTTVPENRKRKNKIAPIIPKSKSTSSIDSTGVDIDSEHSSKRYANTKRICKPNITENNTVNTLEESYTLYKTYAPTGQILPEFANPPDVAIKTSLTNQMTSDAEIHLITSCTEASVDSNFSLVTLQSKGNTSIPKCHLSIQIYPDSIDINNLNSIPQNNQFVYELLLIDDTLAYYKHRLSTFIKWAVERNAPFIITIPEILSTDLKESLEDILIDEICRPFIPVASTSSTT